MRRVVLVPRAPGLSTSEGLGGCRAPGSACPGSRGGMPSGLDADALQEAVQLAREKEQQLAAKQEVCNETMLALWEECKPCLKHTCMRFYSRTCRSGSGLVGRQVSGPAAPGDAEVGGGLWPDPAPLPGSWRNSSTIPHPSPSG